MLILSPYDTTIGKLLKTESTINALIKFLAGNSDKSYDYGFLVSHEVKLVFIIGYNEDEKDLPLWEHPLVFKDHRGTNIVAVDLRKYVKTVNEQPSSLTTIIKDASSFNFILVRTLATADFVLGNYGNFRSMYKNITTAFSVVVSSIINTIFVMSPVEKVHVEIVLAHYVNLLFTDSEDVEDMVPIIIARIQNSHLSLPVSKQVIVNVVEKLDHNVKTVDELMNNIKLVLPENKTGLINTNVLVNSIANIWYGPGGAETVVMSLEHMPTWIALLYVGVTDPGFKRTRLAMLLDKYSKQIKNSEYEKSISLYIKEHTI